MGTIGEKIMDIAYQEYLKKDPNISFNDWFDTIVMQDDNFDESFRKARQIYSEKSRNIEKEKN